MLGLKDIKRGLHLLNRIPCTFGYFCQNYFMLLKDTIIALSTAPGIGAIAVLRISGPEAITLAERHFQALNSKPLSKQKSHSIHLGYIVDNKTIIDKVLISLFKSPNSYTGEHVIEISCHGSRYIQQKILEIFISSGCRLAEPGEFTLRAFLHGKMDLSQAEAVADLIASESEAAHSLALQQMRGGIGDEIRKLREELVNFAALIELELDFSGEDVEFADKYQFKDLLNRIRELLKNLLDSFQLGNAIKQGIPVAIIGEPNVGKSTLLNALLNEEKAIVSDIPGTTRDAIEDEIQIRGIGFRFIDTAGLRDTEDVIEEIGIQRTHEKIAKARLVLHLSAANETNSASVNGDDISQLQEQYPEKKFIRILTKKDLLGEKAAIPGIKEDGPLYLSAKTGEGVDQLKSLLYDLVMEGEVAADQTLLSNSRHFAALQEALKSIVTVQEGLEAGHSGDLLAVDIRQALEHLGEITGEVTTDELLGNIFSNFCIGK